jgi:hypothetical protein
MKTKIDQLNKRVNRPLSPGEIVAGILEEQEITQTQAASHLGISRTSLNELINNRRALTPDMASFRTLFRQRHRRVATHAANGGFVRCLAYQSRYEAIEPLRQVA